LEAASATPNEIMRSILRAPVDLLWNGGIGTYVKAQDERNAEVGDRANDALRINGRELRAKVVGEGGNLGLTQRGRVEYALAGGRLNTDFIDNSAGVNTSDVEVNIKILLNPLVAERKLSRSDRNRLLSRQTSEVAALVLRNNYLQSQALSTLEAQSAARLPEFQHLIRSLERSGELSRALEFLPSDDELAERRKSGIGLTRPELAILLAYSKIWLNNHLLPSEVPAGLQYEGSFQTSRLLRHATYWLLTSRSSLQVDAAVGEFRAGVRALEAEIPQALTGAELTRFEESRARLAASGMPPPLASRV